MQNDFLAIEEHIGRATHAVESGLTWSRLGWRPAQFKRLATHNLQSSRYAHSDAKFAHSLIIKYHRNAGLVRVNYLLSYTDRGMVKLLSQKCPNLC